MFTRSRAFGHGSETIVSPPSRREVALASEDDTTGLADPPFQLWYETTFSSSLSTLNCSCTFCRRPNSKAVYVGIPAPDFPRRKKTPLSRNEPKQRRQGTERVRMSQEQLPFGLSEPVLAGIQRRPDPGLTPNNYQSICKIFPP